MEHHFDIDVAKEYGIAEAIIINNFQFWINKNRANGSHQHDGRTWTYNSQKALMDLFPYLSRQSLRTAIKHLCDKGVIIIGNYETDPFKKTNWYAFVDESKWIGCYKPEEGLKETQRVVDSNQRVVDSSPYTDNNNTNNNPTNINTDNNKRKKKKEELDLSFVSTEYMQAFGEWLEYKKKRGEMYETQRGVQRAYRDLLTACNSNPRFALAVVNESIDKEYKGIFASRELKQQIYGSNNQTAGNMFSAAADELRRQGATF